MLIPKKIECCFNIDELKKYDKEIDKHIKIQMKYHLKYIDSHIVNILNHFAIPKIKGEITKGKIKWRGIKLYIQGDYMWLVQRNKQIGYKIYKHFKINENENQI